MSQRPAIFFDRDGTLIEHVHYLVDPRQVRLVEHAAAAICQLKALGFLCIVVTNQSVIEKKMLDLAGLDLIHNEMIRQLSKNNAQLDAIFHCPRASLSGDPTQIEFEDRKPGPGMLHRAAREFDIDLSKSWMIGDSVSDVLAGHHASCRGCIWIKKSPKLAPPALDTVRWLPANSISDAACQIAATAR